MAEDFGNLTQEEIEDLDWRLKGYDAAGFPPLESIAQKLLDIGIKFNPKPATKDDINKYLTSRNRSRDSGKQIPPLP
jgi:hypothetical protein